jgi:hypothetical protein
LMNSSRPCWRPPMRSAWMTMVSPGEF